MKKFWIGFLVGIGVSIIGFVALGYFLGKMMGFDEEGLSAPDLILSKEPKFYNYSLKIKNLISDSIVDSREFTNKVVFLNFWEHWCLPCKKEMPSLQRLYNTVRDSSVFFGFVSTEDVKLTRKDAVINKYNLPFYYSDKILPQEFVNDVVPRTYIIDKKGRIVVEEIGASSWDDERIVRLIDSLKKND